MSEKPVLEPLVPLKGHEERLAAILERHRLTSEASAAPIEEANPGTSAFEVAEKRAARFDLSVAELLAHDMNLLETSSYPTSECLEPYEVELYLVGQLADDRAAHASGCSGCGALLAALAPREDDVKKLLQDVRADTPLGARVQPAQPEAEDHRSSATPSPFVRDALAATAPLAAVLTVVALVARPRFLSGLAAAGGALTLVLLACGAAALFARLLWHNGFLRASGGALIGGILGAVVVFGLAWYMGQNQRQATGALLALTEARVADIAANSFEQKLATGRFMAAAGQQGPLRVTSELHGPSHAIYEASTSGLPGVMIASLSGTTGKIFFQREGAGLPALASSQVESVRARLLVGRVTLCDRAEIRIEDSNGTQHRLKIPAGEDAPPVGHQIMALLDVSSSEVKAIYDISIRGETDR